MKSKVIFENQHYSVCLTRAGLSVQSKTTGRGKILPTSADSFNHWLKEFETPLDATEAHYLARGFLQGAQ